MQEQDIEIQIWDYIDGNCSNENRARISELIITNTVWQNKHQELLAIHNSLNTNLEAKHTSTAFTADTMNKLQPSTPQKLKPLFTWVTRAIAVFFILSTLSFTIYSISKADWSLSNNILPEFNFNITEGMPVSYLIFGILIFGLLCIDQLLKKRATGL